MTTVTSPEDLSIHKLLQLPNTFAWNFDPDHLSTDHSVFAIDADNSPSTGSCRLTAATGGNVLTDPQKWTFVTYGVQ